MYLAQYRLIKRSLKVGIDKVRQSNKAFLAVKPMNLEEVGLNTLLPVPSLLMGYALTKTILVCTGYFRVPCFLNFP